MKPIQHIQTAEFSVEHRSCGVCRNQDALNIDFSYAYQPIVDIETGIVFAHEALVRGPKGEGALSVLEQVNEDNRYRFDQACRVKAIETAARLDMHSKLSINFMPNAIYRPELCIRTTLEAAKAHHFPVERIIFETIEGERVNDGKWLAEILREYQRIGFLTAIDDFGAGFAGLNLLADFQPDIIKLDMDLIRNVDQRPARQAIVRGVVRIAEELGITIIAEGIETVGEFDCLKEMGVRLIQGYLLSKPLFEACLPSGILQWPVAMRAPT